MGLTNTIGSLWETILTYKFRPDIVARPGLLLSVFYDYRYLVLFLPFSTPTHDPVTLTNLPAPPADTLLLLWYFAGSSFESCVTTQTFRVYASRKRSFLPPQLLSPHRSPRRVLANYKVPRPPQRSAASGRSRSVSYFRLNDPGSLPVFR